MLNRYIKQLPHRFARFLYIQLVVSIYSLLILVFWGLPFCPLTFLGNLLFNPVLVLFLGLCTLLFFTELCFIPNDYIICALEYITQGWLFFLNFGATGAYNISCAKPSYWVVALIACITFFVVVRKDSYRTKNISLLFILIGGFWCMSQSQKIRCFSTSACTKGEIQILHAEHEIIVIDPGYLGRYASAPAYVEYTLVPLLRQQFGTHHIDHFIILQPNQTIFQALSKLFEIATIKHLYIPVWSGNSSKKMLFSYMGVKKIADQKNCTIHRLKYETYDIIKTLSTQVKLIKNSRHIATSTISYDAYTVSGTIDNQPFTFYPAKCSQQILKQC